MFSTETFPSAPTAAPSSSAYGFKAAGVDGCAHTSRTLSPAFMPRSAIADLKRNAMQDKLQLICSFLEKEGGLLHRQTGWYMRAASDDYWCLPIKFQQLKLQSGKQYKARKVVFMQQQSYNTRRGNNRLPIWQSQRKLQLDPVTKLP